MALSNTEYNAILREYEALQAEEQQVIRERKAELNRVLPAYREIEQKIAARAMERYLSHMQGDENGLCGIKEELAALEAEKLALLRQAGYPADFLRPAYRCEACRDTGFVAREDSRRASSGRTSIAFPSTTTARSARCRNSP